MSIARHVLVATDFGPASERALDSALELAERFDAKLTIVHVLEPAPPQYGLGFPVPPLPIDALNAQRARVIKELESTVARARERRPNAQGIFRDGKPWGQIVRTAKELQVDLIVVGSHGRRGLPHQLLGSVAERVVRLSPVPVLTVHGYWFEGRVDAGEQLAAALAPWGARSPAVVAISRGGILVGAEVARAFRVSLDVLLTGHLEWHKVPLGAVCEGGITHFAPGAVQSVVEAEQRQRLLSGAQAKLEEDASKIRGNAWLGDLWRRTVIVVSDCFSDPWRPLAAADALAKMGTEAVVFAAPVASAEALSVLKEHFHDVVVLHSLRAHAEPSAAYRDFRRPSETTLAKHLHATTDAALLPPEGVVIHG